MHYNIQFIRYLNREKKKSILKNQLIVPERYFCVSSCFVTQKMRQIKQSEQLSDYNFVEIAVQQVAECLD